MKNPKIINYPDMKVIMRKDFYDEFGKQLKKIAEDTGAIYFAHNIIKDYRQKNHRVSTFCNHDSWHELYWENYRNNDPIEEICHQVVQKNDFSVVSWKIEGETSLCCQERLKATATSDGINFSFKKRENYNETFVFGWNKLKTEALDIDYIFYLSSLLKPIRDYHWGIHDKI